MRRGTKRILAAEKKAHRKKWRLLLWYLRKRFPVQQPTRTMRRKLGKKADLGLTTFNGHSYRVRVHDCQDYSGQIDTLLHEWAHVLAIEEAYQHKGRWAEIYGELVETYYNDFYALMKQRGIK